MSASVLAIADAVVALIASEWNAYPGGAMGASDGAARVYEVEIITDPDDAAVLVGRQVYVFPAGYSTAQPATRGQDFRDYQITVLCCERYTGQGSCPTAWLDDRVYWAEQVVWRPLDNPRLTPVAAGVYPIRAEVVPYDIEELVQRKLWLSVTNATLREVI